MRKLLQLLAVCCASFASIGDAQADLIRLGTQNISLAPNGTTSYTVQLFNDTIGGNQSDPANRLFGWSLGLLVVPQVGSTGSVTIGTPAYPGSNQVIPTANASPSGAPSSAANGSYPSAVPGSYLLSAATDNAVNSYSVTNAGKNMVTL